MRELDYKIESPPLRYEALQNFSISYGLAGNTGLDLLGVPSIQETVRKANDPYLHWDEIKRKSWIPEPFLEHKELFWTLIKTQRKFNSRPTIIKDQNYHEFYMNAGYYSKFLHIMDKETAGKFMGVSNFSDSDTKQFIAHNLIGEAIASSQLEGANTSRLVAKRMLEEGRKPQNHSELMIVNNYNAILKIEHEYSQQAMSFELLCELHFLVTQGTLAEDKQGKLRETLDDKGERLKVRFTKGKSQYIAYTTPDKQFVETEILKLIDFANDKLDRQDFFIHPIIKAIMLHFWIGLLHPFEDGNGRLARILFYWYLLKNEYWAFRYLSISEKILDSRQQYAMSYIYSEQDGCDLNYFIDYNIKKIALAREDFQKYMNKQIEKNRSIHFLNSNTWNLNHRQIHLLRKFYQKEEIFTNILSYKNLYSVGKITAISDLKDLTEKGFLNKNKKGRNVYYYPTEQINEIFK